MAAEFVACFEASNQGLWLRNFVTGLRILKGIERPLKLYCDNNSAVMYSNNNSSSSKSKHIDIKFLAVKERIQSSQICIEHIGTNSIVADPLTKGLAPKVDLAIGSGRGRVGSGQDYPYPRTPYPYPTW